MDATLRGQHSVHQTAEAKAFRHHTMDICAALRSRRKKKKNRKIKRNSQKEFQFDSITAYRYAWIPGRRTQETQETQDGGIQCERSKRKR